MKKAATKRDIIPATPTMLPMKRIHAIMLGLDTPTREEQIVIAAVVSLASSGMNANAFKHMSPDDRMALSKLSEIGLFSVNTK